MATVWVTPLPAVGRGMPVEYVVLEQNDLLRLTAEVHRRIGDGWKPLGGVACYYHPAHQSLHYVQAMVREPAGAV